MFENVDAHTHTYIRTTEAYLSYKLTTEPKGSGELKIWPIFLTVLSDYWYNIMQISHVIVHLDIVNSKSDAKSLAFNTIFC